MPRLRLSTSLVAIFLLLYGVAGRSDESLDALVKRLEAVGTFAFGGVGFAGVVSKGEIDYRFVLSQPAPVALDAFEKVYAFGNPQAKAYALAGIKKLDFKRFGELLANAGVSGDKVQVMRGCIITREPLGSVAKEIDGGDFRF